MAEQYNAPHEAETKGGNVLIPETPTEPNVAPETLETQAAPARPANLPAKFNSWDDMALAYANLEARHSANTKSGDATSKDGGTPPAPAGPAELTQGTMQALYDEFAASGRLSPATYQMLNEKHGLVASTVDAHIAALQGQAALQANAVYALAGGQDEYNAMIAWARRELPAEKQQGYNDLIAQASASGNMSLVETAVSQLRNEWQASEGARPKQPSTFVTPAGGPVQSGFGPITPFASDEEMHAAQRDPRYHQRADYREWVYKRINAGGI